MTNNSEPVVYRLTCRGCGSQALESAFSLGNLCLCNTFIETPEEEVRIPLDLVICDVRRGGCGLVQLRHTTPPNLMYRQYWYKSGLSAMMRTHLAALATRAQELAAPRSGDIVLDIGANDGTTLRSYTAPNVVKVGFEPNQLAKEARRGTDVVVNDFFSAEQFRRHLGRKKAKIVSSIAMFYDLEDPNAFIADVRACLAPDGLWIVEMHYLGTMVEANGFDAIVHEHVTYYSLRSLMRLLDAHGLTVFDVEFNGMNGGSFRAYICHKDSVHRKGAKARARIKAVLDYEKRLALEAPETYVAFKKRVDAQGRRLRRLLGEIRDRGESAFVYGASTKGNALLQHWGIDRTLIAAAADKNSDKWGLHTPGSRIPIVSPAQAAKANPNYFLVLIWHLMDEVIDQWSDYIGRGGKLISPLPAVEVIAANSRRRPSVAPSISA